MTRKAAKQQRGKLAAIVLETGGSAAAVARYERVLSRHRGQGLLRSPATARRAVQSQLDAASRTTGAPKPVVRVHSHPARLSVLAPTARSFKLACDLGTLPAVTPRARELFARFGVRTHASALGLVQSYPSLFLDADLSALQAVLARRAPAAVRAMSTAGDLRARLRFSAKLGTRVGPEPFPDARRLWSVRATHSNGPRRAGSAAHGASSVPPDDGLNELWPVRDQGDRGTCVAFAAVACLEEWGKHSLSEQFLYWAIKTVTADGWPDEDGTRLEFAHQALAMMGVCASALWRYDGAHVPENIAHQDRPHKPLPCPNCIADAAGRQLPKSVRPKPRDSQQLVQLLDRTKRPVAVEFPVYALSSNPGVTNWDDDYATTYGVIGEAPSLPADGPQWTLVGAHAVAIVGYVLAESPGGGAFIFRNSWSEGWAHALDPNERLSRQRGYGQVSFQHVDRLAWDSWTP